MRKSGLAGSLYIDKLAEVSPSDSAYVTTRETLDPEALRFAMPGARIEPCQLDAVAGPSRFSRLVCPDVAISFAALGSAVTYTGTTPADRVTLVFVLRCPALGRSFTFGVEHTAGYLGVFPPGTRFSGTKPLGYSHAALSVTPERLRAASEPFRQEPRAELLENGGIIEVATGVRAELAALLSGIEEVVWEDPGVFHALPVRETAERELLAAYAAALAEGSQGPGGGKLRSTISAVRYERLCRAKAFISKNAHRPIRLDDLCAALDLSRRGVEAVFHDLLGVSPITYLRHHRLHGARRSLRSVTPHSGVVKRVALDWGFWHLGRFSVEYRKLFGESPSETLGMADDADVFEGEGSLEG